MELIQLYCCIVKSSAVYTIHAFSLSLYTNLLNLSFTKSAIRFFLFDNDQRTAINLPIRFHIHSTPRLPLHICRFETSQIGKVGKPKIHALDVTTVTSTSQGRKLLERSIH